MNLYRIEDRLTKEVHEGTAKKLGDLIGVTSGTICKKALEYGFVADRWRVTKIAENVQKQKRAEKMKRKRKPEKSESLEIMKCIHCGNPIPVNKKSYYCTPKCGVEYRQKEQSELMKEDYKLRLGKTKNSVKPKFSIVEISARAKAAGMTYGQYVSLNGL